ncbi:MAG TPA: DMT family transporter [Acidimicrobiia bacterium]
MTERARVSSSTRDLALAMLAAFCFGVTIVLQRWVAKEGVSSATALSLRFTIAGMLLLAMLRVAGRPLLPPPGERFRAIFLGAGLYTFEATSFYLALQRGTAAAVALLFYLYPAVVTIVEVVLGTMRVRAVTVVSLVLALVGGTTVAVGGGRVAITVSGIGFVLCSVALFSTYVVAGHRVIPRTDALTAATWTALGAAGGVTAIGVGQRALHAPSGRAMLAIATTAAATAIAFTLFFVVLSRLGPSRTAIVMALEAVFGVVLSAVFLGESLRPLVVVGGVAILAGAVLAAVSQPAEQQEAAPPP